MVLVWDKHERKSNGSEGTTFARFGVKEVMVDLGRCTEHTPNISIRVRTLCSVY